MDEEGEERTSILDEEGTHSGVGLEAGIRIKVTFTCHFPDFKAADSVHTCVPLGQRAKKHPKNWPEELERLAPVRVACKE